MRGIDNPQRSCHSKHAFCSSDLLSICLTRNKFSFWSFILSKMDSFSPSTLNNWWNAINGALQHYRSVFLTEVDHEMLQSRALCHSTINPHRDEKHRKNRTRKLWKSRLHEEFQRHNTVLDSHSSSLFFGFHLSFSQNHMLRLCTI